MLMVSYIKYKIQQVSASLIVIDSCFPILQTLHNAVSDYENSVRKHTDRPAASKK